MPSGQEVHGARKESDTTERLNNDNKYDGIIMGPLKLQRRQHSRTVCVPLQFHK